MKSNKNGVCILVYLTLQSCLQFQLINPCLIRDRIQSHDSQVTRKSVRKWATIFCNSPCCFRELLHNSLRPYLLFHGLNCKHRGQSIGAWIGGWCQSESKGEIKDACAYSLVLYFQAEIVTANLRICQGRINNKYDVSVCEVVDSQRESQTGDLFEDDRQKWAITACTCWFRPLICIN